MATTARVPALERARARRLAGPLAAAASVAAGAVALRLRDPHRHGSWGFCPFKALTGWNCPFCGGLRAVNDLGHGRLAEAAHSNLLLVGLLLPLAIGAWAVWLRNGWSGRSTTPAPVVARVLGTGLVVVAIAFTVYRNTPWGSGWRAA